MPDKPKLNIADSSIPEDPPAEIAAAAPDPFNVDALQLNQSFEEAIGVRKLLTTMPVRKPHKQEWLRVHPHEKYRGTFAMINLKEDGEFYLLTPDIARELTNELFRAVIYTAINRQAVPFLWPARLPAPDGRSNAWHISQHEAAGMGMQRLIRVKANIALGAYEIDITDNPTPDPEWPNLPFGELLRIGFKNGKLIDSLEHPVVKQLRGL